MSEIRDTPLNILDHVLASARQHSASDLKSVRAEALQTAAHTGAYVGHQLRKIVSEMTESERSVWNDIIGNADQQLEAIMDEGCGVDLKANPDIDTWNEAWDTILNFTRRVRGYVGTVTKLRSLPFEMGAFLLTPMEPKDRPSLEE